MEQYQSENTLLERGIDEENTYIRRTGLFHALIIGFTKLLIFYLSTFAAHYCWVSGTTPLSTRSVSGYPFVASLVIHLHQEKQKIAPMKEPMRLIRIENPQECRIIERLNRFVVLIELEGTYHRAHITNTGRLTEFMVKGQQAFCFRTHHQGKTDFRLFAIADRGFGALIDTWLQMNAFEEALKRNRIPWLDGCRMRKRNALLGASRSRSRSQSRIDYLLDCHGKEVYLEVKSAVLRDREYAMYPDCPSARGRKHIRELSRYVKAGGTGILVFMAALPYVTAFTPNTAADAELSEAFMAAHASGVDVRAIALYYNPRDAFVYLVNPDLPIVLLS